MTRTNPCSERMAATCNERRACHDPRATPRQRGIIAALYWSWVGVVGLPGQIRTRNMPSLASELKGKWASTAIDLLRD